LAVLFGLVELATSGFFFIFFAGGALTAAAVAMGIHSPLIQTGVFLADSIALTLFARPVLRKALNVGDRPAKASNVHALIGKEVLVLETVDKYVGKVKVVHTGEVWSAYLAQPAEDDTLEINLQGEIVHVDGAKLAIRPKATKY
jgi:membrane protein implicated in regulation of membrane protease activity